MADETTDMVAFLFTSNMIHLQLNQIHFLFLGVSNAQLMNYSVRQPLFPSLEISSSGAIEYIRKGWDLHQFQYLS